MYAAPPADSPIGWLPFPNRDTGAFVAGVPRGRIDAGTLADLAKLAERHADGTLRMTPWRAFAFVPVRTADGVPLTEAIRALSLITDPADPRRALRGHDIAPVGGANHQRAASP
jgi:precorrin-3B synthase